MASAMLAGVLLSVCLGARALRGGRAALRRPDPVTWAVLLRFARRWAIPGALVAAALVVAVDPSGRDSGIGLLPSPCGPRRSSSRAPCRAGAATVHRHDGLPERDRDDRAGDLRLPAAPAAACWPGPARRRSGRGPFGGHGLNLAAISAALTAGPDGGRDPARRWVAATADGVTTIASASAPG